MVHYDFLVLFCTYSVRKICPKNYVYVSPFVLLSCAQVFVIVIVSLRVSHSLTNMDHQHAEAETKGHHFVDDIFKNIFWTNGGIVYWRIYVLNSI